MIERTRKDGNRFYLRYDAAIERGYRIAYEDAIYVVTNVQRDAMDGWLRVETELVAQISR